MHLAEGPGTRHLLPRGPAVARTVFMAKYSELKVLAAIPKIDAGRDLHPGGAISPGFQEHRSIGQRKP